MSESNLENKQLRATQIYSYLKDMHSLTVLLQLEVEKMKTIHLEVQGV